MIAREGNLYSNDGPLYLDAILFTGGDAASYTNGFPSRLIYDVDFPAGPSTRLIPEMNFACNGVIVGYTAALRWQPGQRGDQGPIIQVWRKNTTIPGSYYKTNIDIAINNASCDGGLTMIESKVFHCSFRPNLTTTRVTVQPGDILGLELPVEHDDDMIRLAFASVSSGPTNYVFNTREGPSMYSGALLNSWWHDNVTRALPQINLEVESGKSRTHA